MEKLKMQSENRVEIVHEALKMFNIAIESGAVDKMVFLPKGTKAVFDAIMKDPKCPPSTLQRPPSTLTLQRPPTEQITLGIQ